MARASVVIVAAVVVNGVVAVTAVYCDMMSAVIYGIVAAESLNSCTIEVIANGVVVLCADNVERINNNWNLLAFDIYS